MIYLNIINYKAQAPYQLYWLLVCVNVCLCVGGMCLDSVLKWGA